MYIFKEKKANSSQNILEIVLEYDNTNIENDSFICSYKDDWKKTLTEILIIIENIQSYIKNNTIDNHPNIRFLEEFESKYFYFFGDNIASTLLPLYKNSNDRFVNFKIFYISRYDKEGNKTLIEYSSLKYNLSHF